MSLGHVYIVLEPVGSARLTFDDDLYYELCDLIYRRLFGVPDEITDVTRSLKMIKTLRLIYWKVAFGYQNGFRKYRIIFGVPGGYRNPPGD